MHADLEVHLAPSSYLAALRADVSTGLTAEPKTLPPKYFYDARGSELFDEITRLPEYYPTRAETVILRQHAEDIARLSQARTLVELGSGTSAKTRLLLRALTEAGTLERFMPFDVDPVVLTRAAELISAEYPQLTVAPVIGDFEEHLGLLAGGHLTNLGSIRLQRLGLLVAAVLLRLGTETLLNAGFAPAETVRLPLLKTRISS